MPARLNCELPGLFITGTDTGVGKTWVSAQIVQALRRRKTRVGVVKPAATGLDPAGPLPTDSDAAILTQALGWPVPVDLINPIRLVAPLAPPVAARLEGNTLEYPELLRRVQESIQGWSLLDDVMLVEGVGGLLCPLAEQKAVADLAIECDFPLVIVARRGLGTLNHTLLTVEAARLRGLRIAGVILNGSEPTGADPRAEQTNADELSRWLEKEPILAEIPHQASDSLVASIFDSIDWQSFAMRSRRCSS